MGQEVKNLCEYVGGIHWGEITMDFVVDFLHNLQMKDARWVVVVRGKEVYINKEVMMETTKLPHIVKKMSFLDVTIIVH
jgi:hypothetical protein